MDVRWARAGCLVAILASSVTALAQGDRDARAHALFREGQARYTSGDYDEAIRAFQEAWTRSHAAGLLFNLAQAWRLKGDRAQAVSYYRAYLRERPDAPNRADAEARIAEMEAPEPPPAIVEAPQPVITPPPPPRRHHVEPRRDRTLLWAGVATAAAGAAVLGGGIGLGVDAMQVQDQLSTLSHDRGTWNATAQASYDRGQREAIAATVLDVVGGAAAAAGTVMAVLGARNDRLHRLAVAPSASGLSVVAGWRF